MSHSRGVPVGVLVLQKCFSLGRYRRKVFQVVTLVLTFVAYTAYHMSRRPLAIVKNSLNKDCSRELPPPTLVINDKNRDNWCDWPPFDGADANRLLGVLDSIFVFAYAGCMFGSGMLAERIDLRYYLSLGMVVSGILTYFFGIAYYLGIHSYAFFLIVQLLGGAVQSTGWPGVVSCVGNWFGKSRRGLIFGIWNAHLYVGNILGAYVAGYFVAENWGLSFIVPSVIVAGTGFILFLFLVPHPEDIDSEETQAEVLSSVDSELSSDVQDNNKTTLGSIVTNYPIIVTEQTKLTAVPIVSNTNLTRKKHTNKQAITFLNALKIPGVLEFSMCLFFSKLVSSTVLFWLPRYLDHTTGIGSQMSAYFSIAFDVGGILGGIIAGVISDYTGSSAITCISFLGLATPMLFIYQAYGNSCILTNVVLQLICGSFVNGPYALITTAVSAELGTHPTIQSNSKALPTVAAIIDGTGSIGAAVGPLLAGIISEVSWPYVFYMMMFADFCALLALVRPALKELDKLCNKNFCLNPFRPLFYICRRKEKNEYSEI